VLLGLTDSRRYAFVLLYMAIVMTLLALNSTPLSTATHLSRSSLSPVSLATCSLLPPNKLSHKTLNIYLNDRTRLSNPKLRAASPYYSTGACRRYQVPSASALTPISTSPLNSSSPGLAADIFVTAFLLNVEVQLQASQQGLLCELRQRWQ
jgi:hypothetical protein